MPKNWFNRSLPIPKIHHSVHDLSNDYKSSINFGGLYPIYVEETLPSDKFLNLSSEVFLRFAPMKFPIMHRCKVRTNYFAVPYRLIMGNENYELFHNNQRNLPYLTFDTNQDNYTTKNTIFDYLGFDVKGLDAQISRGADFVISGAAALWLLSYWIIWRTWYADEVFDVERINSIDMLIEDYRRVMSESQPGVSGEVLVNWEDGGQRDYLESICPVSYEKDYFTAAQPEPQRGGDVYLMNPLTLTGVNSNRVYSLYASDAMGEVGLNPQPSIEENLRSTETIRDLWQKEQLQRYRDISALFGDRTNEYLAGHFGVISSDARLQMPQFIGGGQQIVQIQEVTQTSSDTENSPLGSLAGKATSFGRTKSFKYFAEEHMSIFGLLSIVPDNGYTSGNPRVFYKSNIFDFASPEFNNIGYQPVYNGEIFAQGTAADTAEFGYQPRYSEYRVHRSLATGDFRDETLMAWHLNRSFASLPPLNENFIHVNVKDSSRIFNDTDPDAQHIYVDVFNKVSMYRPVNYMPSSLHL